MPAALIGGASVGDAVGAANEEPRRYSSVVRNATSSAAYSASWGISSRASLRDGGSSSERGRAWRLLLVVDNQMPMPITSPSAAVLSTAKALPSHRYDQADLAALAQRMLPELALDQRGLLRFFRSVSVQHRHLALDKDAYARLGGLEGRSRAWLEVALELGQRCIEDVLRDAQIPADSIAHLMTTTVTGISVPTLDARLMNRIPFAPSLKRVPAFGLGCVGGAAGVARVADYLRAFPTHAGILLSVELCSLTFQKEDLSPSNVISMGLFGDGAAAVLMVGAEHPLANRALPRIVDSESVFFPNTERMMGWDIVDSGFKVVLDPKVPELARENLRPAVDAFLARHQLERRNIRAWVCHPGGPKVMDAVAEGLELDAEALRPARDGLVEVGNLSSASVLFLLDEFRGAQRPEPGSFGVMLAMGPAFCAELVLLQW